MPSAQCLLVDDPVFNVIQATSPINVTLSESRSTINRHEGKLRLPGLSKEASKCYIFYKMVVPLISIGKFLDDGCDAVFTKTDMWIKNDNKQLFRGSRDLTTDLWTVDMGNTNLSMCEGLDALQYISKSALANELVEERITFLHAYAGYPVQSTWCDAIDVGNYATWSGLTAKLFRKYLGPSKLSISGHLDQSRQNQRSNKRPQDKPKTITVPKETKKYVKPPASEPRSHQVYSNIVEVTGQIYSDQTGKFVTASNSVNRYLMIVYYYDNNIIHAESLKSRASAKMVRAFTKIHDYLASPGCKLKL